ncbi:hypothetical protein NBRC116493_02640 [Aurantivibrio infirmus]
MSRMKKAIAGLVVLSLCSLVGVMWLISIERVHSRFDNYQGMETSGIFEAGWLPPYLPKSATNIREKHDIDTNFVHATFEYEQQDKSSVIDNCQIIEHQKKVTIFNCNYRGNEAVLKLYNNGFAEYSSLR